MKKVDLDLGIKEKHYSPIVDARVQHAVTNLITNYSDDILPSSSLPERGEARNFSQ